MRFHCVLLLVSAVSSMVVAQVFDNDFVDEVMSREAWEFDFDERDLPTYPEYSKRDGTSSSSESDDDEEPAWYKDLDKKRKEKKKGSSKKGSSKNGKATTYTEKAVTENARKLLAVFHPQGQGALKGKKGKGKKRTGK